MALIAGWLTTEVGRGLAHLARGRDLKRFLHDIRVLGLTRPSGPAAGLPDDVHLGRNDIPPEPANDEAGRDLSAWVLRIICDNLGLVAPYELSAEIAVR